MNQGKRKCHSTGPSSRIHLLASLLSTQVLDTLNNRSLPTSLLPHLLNSETRFRNEMLPLRHGAFTATESHEQLVKKEGVGVGAGGGLVDDVLVDEDARVVCHGDFDVLQDLDAVFVRPVVENAAQEVG